MLFGSLAVVLYGCRTIPEQPDRELIANAVWDIVTQQDDHINLGAQLILQHMNMGRLHTIDLTASSYNGSVKDTTFNPNGFPIVALQQVRVANGKVLPLQENRRVMITNLPSGNVDILFTVLLLTPVIRQSTSLLFQLEYLLYIESMFTEKSRGCPSINLMLLMVSNLPANLKPLPYYRFPFHSRRISQPSSKFRLCDYRVEGIRTKHMFLQIYSCWYSTIRA
ncbi:MAG TPA: hypothetical protein VGT05_02645 [Patescibacteria group bacterium]|nr:hypothetical protein [Patescibacteria group bacterium]